MDEEKERSASQDPDLATALGVLRLVRGWSQAELEAASGVRSSSISNYELGKTTPELRTLRRLVEGMGFPLASLDRARLMVQWLRRTNGTGGEGSSDEFEWWAPAEMAVAANRLMAVSLELLSRAGERFFGPRPAPAGDALPFSSPEAASPGDSA